MMNETNKALEREVAAQLHWDLLLDSSRISVNAEHTTVTLTGFVYTYEELLLAEDDARGARGVTGVHNELLVGPGECVGDEQVTTECARALEATKAVPTGSISVHVSDGWVTMFGRVQKQFQRVEAKHAIARVTGVRGITDKIVISGDPFADEIGAQVGAALARNRLLKDASLRVSSLGTTVFLDGAVTSYTAKRAARDIARCTPGVLVVLDRTTVAA
jgi:osmotically-inducible protein OsmY